MSRTIKLHEKGEKASRDRVRCVQKYDEFCQFFHVRRIKDSELAKLSNNEIYNLTEDMYNRQPAKKKNRYAQYLGIGRENDTSFRWWWLDCVHVYKPTAIGYLMLALKAPKLYPDYVRRKKASIAKRKADAEAAKKAMQDAARAPKIEVLK